MNHVAKYKEIASKGSQKYKKVRGGALADQEIGPWWSLAAQLWLRKLISSAPRNTQKIVAKYKES